MKKCPYCAEEIQDEAIFCRWCNHDLIEEHPKTDTISKKRGHQTDPAEGPRRNPFWIAMGIGLCGGVATWIVRSQKGIVFPKYGFSGFFNDLVLSTITSFLVWGLITSVIIWFWRIAIRQTPGIKSFSRDSGCVSGLIFITFSVLFVFFVMANTNTEKLSEVTNTLAARKDVQESQPKTFEEPQEDQKPVLVTATPRPIIKVYFPPVLPDTEKSSYQKFYQSSADSLGKFFGGKKILDYRSYFHGSLPPFEEFAEYYEISMTAQGFELEEKGGNYLIFYLSSENVHMGIVYDSGYHKYAFAQW